MTEKKTLPIENHQEGEDLFGNREINNPSITESIKPVKSSFLLHADYSKHFKKLDQKEKGDLLDAIFAFANNEEIPELSDRTDMAFSFIESQLERDYDKWVIKCEKNRKNGKLGGRPPIGEYEQEQYTQPDENGVVYPIFQDYQ